MNEKPYLGKGGLWDGIVEGGVFWVAEVHDWADFVRLAHAHDLINSKVWQRWSVKWPRHVPFLDECGELIGEPRRRCLVIHALGVVGEQGLFNHMVNHSGSSPVTKIIKLCTKRW